MKDKISYENAAEMLISLVKPMDITEVKLEESTGMILAEEICALENVPPFDRSPYDGYAFRAEDCLEASRDNPVTLRITEEIPAGSVPSKEVTEGTAAKILTGAPIPKGADAVIMYEKTDFTADTVTIYSPSEPGDNIIYAGEDVKKGQILSSPGTVIDAGLAGTIASQGIPFPKVYRRPVAGIISTGSELVEITDNLEEGKIRNSNRYTLAAALKKDGCEPKFIGSAGDDPESIKELILKGIRECDLVLLTGGVSAGDYDLTPDAMEKAGCSILARGVDLKPGMACCYGIAEGKPVLALSGNPSSSLTNYYCVVRPAVRKMTGLRPYMPEEIRVELAEPFKKKSKGTRLLKGRLRIENGKAVMHLPKGQGNVMISSSIGCDCMAFVPAGSGPLEAGTILKGFMV